MQMISRTWPLHQSPTLSALQHPPLAAAHTISTTHAQTLCTIPTFSTTLITPHRYVSTYIAAYLSVQLLLNSLFTTVMKIKAYNITKHFRDTITSVKCQGHLWIYGQLLKETNGLPWVSCIQMTDEKAHLWEFENYIVAEHNVVYCSQEYRLCDKHSVTEVIDWDCDWLNNYTEKYTAIYSLSKNILEYRQTADINANYLGIDNCLILNNIVELS